MHTLVYYLFRGTLWSFMSIEFGDGDRHPSGAGLLDSASIIIIMFQILYSRLQATTGRSPTRRN